jgi:pimeloyl-ACP methyl ester carboxylesterase
LTGGSESFLGSVKRIGVVAIPDNASSAPVPTAGSPGYLSEERIAYRRFGSGSDLLLIMGQDGSMSWWEPTFLSLLGQHYRVTVFDLPGVGYSQPPGNTVTLAWLSDETAGLIQALSMSHPTVLGWGLGGDVALELALRHPGSLGDLVLVDTTAGGSQARRPARILRATLDSPWASAVSLAPVVFGPGGSAARAAWLTAMPTGVPDDVTGPALASEQKIQDAVWSSRVLSVAASTLSTPTLVVYGTEDELFPAPDGSLLAGSIPSAKELALPGAGYAAIYEDSTQFVSALEQFTG